MVMFRSPLVFAFALLSGCASVGTVSEDNFAEKYADVFCRQAQKCSRGYYESEFSDMEDCIGEIEEAAEDTMDIADEAGCDFDDGEAKEFLDTLNAASCEEFYEGDAYEDSDKVFDCDDGDFIFGAAGGSSGGDTSAGSDDPQDSDQPDDEGDSGL
jgi:hypothetical protein